MDPDNNKNHLLGSGIMVINPISNYPLFQVNEPTDDSFSNAELDLDDETLGQLAELAIDEEIEDNMD